MASPQSPHLANIPQAIRFAADPAVEPGLKQQALDYLRQVKEACDETWQDCLALYLQGAGAPSEGATGKDGKEKLDAATRMFCQQVIGAVFTSKPESITPEAKQGMYKALLDFVQTEFVEGSCEGGQAFLRNKLALTIAQLFTGVYPTLIPTFLHPFINLLVPQDGATNLHLPLLVTHLLVEIAQEIHDATTREYARRFLVYAKELNQRDGAIRDAVRTTGDERLAVDGLLRLASMGLPLSSDRKWLEVTDFALRALAAWTPWIDLSVSLTPQTLSFYTQVLQQQGNTTLRTGAAKLLMSIANKGIKNPAEKIQVLRVLDLVPLVDPIEQETRGAKDDSDLVVFRTKLAGLLSCYGEELIAITEMDDMEAPEHIRNEADAMLSNAMPLVLRFLSDRHPEVPTAISQCVSDLLKTFKKYKPVPVAAPPKNGRPSNVRAPDPLPANKRQFLLSVLEVVVRQLQWPADAEWEIVQESDPDTDEDIAAFCAMRKSFRSTMDNIASIDKSLHTEVVANIVVGTLERLSTSGVGSISWQEAELAAYLVHTFGEISKSNTRAAFWELPPELLSKTSLRMARSSGKLGGGDAAMASGQSTPTGSADMSLANLDPNAKIDYEQFPLTPLGQLLGLCMTSGLASYPHPSVQLLFFEISVRYIDFWKVKPGAIQPIFESLLDGRGIHHSDEGVRRRAFYLLTRLIKECRVELEASMIPIILKSLQDMLAINPQLPEADTAEEDVLLKATTGRSYFQDQLHLFEAAGVLVYLTRSDPSSQMNFLAAIAGPLMTGIGSGLDQYRRNPSDLVAVLGVHHHLLALGHFAKGFPPVSEEQIDAQPYQQPFKQMTEALLEALDVMKTQRIIRDSARFAFSQFVSAIGSTIAELVPRFVASVVTEFQPTELVDFLGFLSLLMHRLKKNTFETMDMLLLPLLSRIFAVLQLPVTGTDEAVNQRRLQEAYLNFFTALMNSNLEGVFITDRNKPEFENVLTALLELAKSCGDQASQRLAWSFFAKSVIAWGTSQEAATEPPVFADSAKSDYSVKVASGLAPPTNQHEVTKAQRAAQALPGYEQFIYQRLIPTGFQVPLDASFAIKSGQPVMYEIAMVIRNMVQARGKEGLEYLVSDMLPKLGCSPEMAQQFVQSLRTQQSRDFRKTFLEFVKAIRPAPQRR